MSSQREQYERKNVVVVVAQENSAAWRDESHVGEVTKKRPLFTVFTPTYNRAHTLGRLFGSLLSQTLQDFEWIIVDDGSTDHTATLVPEWVDRAGFPIKYFYQVNQGKHVAHNRAVHLSEGDLFLVIDSDDALVSGALERLAYWWRSIPLSQRSQYTGVVCLYQDRNGNRVGDQFPISPMDSNALELGFKLKIRVDTCGFHRSDVLRRYPFPEDGLTKFVPESFVWNQIARTYSLRCVNECLAINYQDAGNQLTKSRLRSRASVRQYFRLMIDRDLDFFWVDPRTFLKWGTLYARYSCLEGDWQFLDRRRFRHVGAYALCVVSAPLGAAMFLLDRLREARGP